jgi:hypothetical protein
MLKTLRKGEREKLMVKKPFSRWTWFLPVRVTRILLMVGVVFSPAFPAGFSALASILTDRKSLERVFEGIQSMGMRLRKSCLSLQEWILQTFHDGNESKHFKNKKSEARNANVYR